MIIRTLCSLSVAFAALFLASGSAAGQKGPALPDILKLGADYLAQYAERLGAVAADEEYTQYETSTGRMSTPKRINAHVVWLGVSDGAVESFRDVVGIDSVPVRPKDQRLLDLFRAPKDASRPQAQEMTDLSVRQYIDGNLHLLDQATLALEFLRAANQEHSAFKLEGVKTMNGAQMAVLKFTEKAQPRLVPSSENAAAVGRFWIETATGTVRQTELGLTARGFNVHTSVKSPMARRAVAAGRDDAEVWSVAACRRSWAAWAPGRQQRAPGARRPRHLHEHRRVPVDSRS